MDPYNTAPEADTSDDGRSEYVANLSLKEMTEMVSAQNNAMCLVLKPKEE